MISFRLRPVRQRSLGLRRVAIAVLLLVGVALPAGVAAATTPVKTGYYADLINVRSTQVTFHLGAHDAVPDLDVICDNPTNAGWLANTGEGAIAVHMPKETVHGGTISYSGPARVTPAYAGAKTAATRTLHVNLHHVNGPVLHYTFEGLKHTQTRAWVGTVSTAACKSLPLGGQVKLYGPG